MIRQPLSDAAKRKLRLLLGLTLLLLHVFVSHLNTPAPRAVEQLPQASNALLQLLALNDPYAPAALGNLWLQNFNASTNHTPSYQAMDYHVLVSWLEALSQLAPSMHYPQFMAARLFSSVNDPAKVRTLLDFIDRSFQRDNRKWRWLAESTLIAKYRLKDLPLAYRFAQVLAINSPSDAPFWVKDMRILLLEDMSEYEAAISIIGAMLASESLKDPYEIRYLTDKLSSLQEKTSRANPSPPP